MQAGKDSPTKIEGNLLLRRYDSKLKSYEGGGGTVTPSKFEDHIPSKGPSALRVVPTIWRIGCVEPLLKRRVARGKGGKKDSRSCGACRNHKGVTALLSPKARWKMQTTPPKPEWRKGPSKETTQGGWGGGGGGGGVRRREEGDPRIFAEGIVIG